MKDEDLRYSYKNKDYIVVSVGKMKHPTTRQWVRCVIYRKVGNPANEECRELFVREKEEFLKKFTKGWCLYEG